MKHQKIVLISLTTCLLIIIYLYHTMQHQTIGIHHITVGILQTASHPALDEAKNGFINTLKSSLGDTIHFIVRNAQGSTIAAHTIAEQFHNDSSIQAIYAIATPALQAAYSVEKEKPIFITAVSNPEIVISLHETTNVCGITDMINIPDQIKAIKQILPTLNSIAIIYNTAEPNSIAQVNIMTKELQKNNIETLLFGITNETELPSAIATALSKANALLAPTDNLIASAMPIISHLAHTAKKPIIASHNQAVSEGALMARGVNYYQCGVETAKIALSVLSHQSDPHNHSIKPAQSDTLLLNKRIMNDLHITIPEKISDKIIFID